MRLNSNKAQLGLQVKLKRPTNPVPPLLVLLHILDEMSSRRMATLLAVGGAARFLLCFTPLPDLLLHRNELTTPLTSFTRRA